ncbi:hypothetical protein HMPREF9594_01970 [Cutibacterium acnes HL005PA1]|nr:hypothetical protein HMPREF9594_01970 [Cutibacterium acnes HL005PA1]EGF68355.1 hypothetical protein HMPREF9563_01616 [Cutibacterium acnes HL020PA1]
MSCPPHREECLVEEALPLSNRVVVFSPGPADSLQTSRWSSIGRIDT